jgi:small subunit ribosomal protein S6
MTELANLVRSKSARQGTQREYETTLIIRPSTSKEGIREFVDRVGRVLTSQSARLQRIDNWGVRTLAYPIAKHRQGIYLYLRYLGGSDVVNELERNLRIYDEVIRYLTVLVDEDVDPTARPTEVTEALLDAAAEASPDPVEEHRKAEEARARDEAERRAAERAEGGFYDDEGGYDDDEDGGRDDDDEEEEED